MAAVLGKPVEDVLDPRPPPHSDQLSPRYIRLLAVVTSHHGIMSCFHGRHGRHGNVLPRLLRRTIMIRNRTRTSPEAMRKHCHRCRKRRPEMDDSGKVIQVDREVALVETDPACVPLGACVEEGRREKQFESQGQSVYHSRLRSMQAGHGTEEVVKWKLGSVQVVSAGQRTLVW